MNREDFMLQTQATVSKIFESKTNGIMNLVRQAWAEGKRSAEVETLRAAIEEALDKKEQKSDSEAVYPTWVEWLKQQGIIQYDSRVALRNSDNSFYEALVCLTEDALKPIPADLAQKLGVEPK